MSRVSGSDFTGLMRSPCYQGGEISCMSCHEMHQDENSSLSQAEWANDQLSDKAHGREGCLQCHEQYRDERKLVDHTHHDLGSSGSDCYNCHMPHTTYGLLKAIRSHQISSPDATATVEYGRPNACNLCHIDQTLAWTAGKLEEWYQIKPPEMTSDQNEIADTIIWSLSGDAGQRALAAASMGWKPAQDASRTDWCAGVLGQLMLDPYDAVRHVAHRSLRSFPEYRKVDFRFTGPVAERRRIVGAIMKHWKSQAPLRSKSPNASVLIGQDGSVLRQGYVRLLKDRDNREVLLAE